MDNYYNISPLERANWSFLKMGITKSWRHAYNAYVLGMQPSPTPAMRRGTLVHLLTLEPHKFSSNYVVAPEINRRTRAGREEWDRFVQQAGQRQIIKQDDYDEAVAIAANVCHHTFYAQVSTDATLDREATVAGDMYGVPCRGRIDMLTSTAVIDLKTCADASPEQFRRSIYRYGYHGQMAFYRDLAGVEDAFIIAVETSGTHEVAIYRMSEKLLSEGQEMYMSALEEFKGCAVLHETLAEDAFPAYSQEPVTI
jgi:hypothetical protein